MQSNTMKCALHLSVRPNRMKRHNLNKKLSNITMNWLLAFRQLESVCFVVAVTGLQVMGSPIVEIWAKMYQIDGTA